MAHEHFSNVHRVTNSYHWDLWLELTIFIGTMYF